MTPERLAQLKALCIDAACLDCDAPGTDCRRCGGTHWVTVQPLIAELAAAVEEAQARAEQAEEALLRGQPRITTRCPSCGSQTLFVGKGGHLTCSLIGCKQPGVASALAAMQAERDALRAGIDAALNIEGYDDRDRIREIADWHRRAMRVVPIEAALTEARRVLGVIVNGTPDLDGILHHDINCAWFKDGSCDCHAKQLKADIAALLAQEGGRR